MVVIKMILEDATFKKFGYYPSALTHGSHKPILAVCDMCGKVRETSKNVYRALCKSCALKGNTHTRGHMLTEEHKAKMSATLKGKYVGKNHPMFGKHHREESKIAISAALMGNTHLSGHVHTEETKALMSAAHKGKYTGDKNSMFGRRGKNSPVYNGGKKVVGARSKAKRKRQLGYTLLIPLEEGEIGHHFTDEDIIGIPAKVHEKFCGYSRKKHRTLVLQWLKANDIKKYNKVLCVLAKEPL